MLSENTGKNEKGVEIEMIIEPTPLQRRIENTVTNGIGFREGPDTGDATELELQRGL